MVSTPAIVILTTLIRPVVHLISFRCRMLNKIILYWHFVNSDNTFPKQCRNIHEYQHMYAFNFMHLYKCTCFSISTFMYLYEHIPTSIYAKNSQFVLSILLFVIILWIMQRHGVVNWVLCMAVGGVQRQMQGRCTYINTAIYITLAWLIDEQRRLLMHTFIQK